MKYVIALVLSITSLATFAGKTKVTITYHQEEVHIVVDKTLYGTDFAAIKIDFETAREIKFYKRGYFTKVVELSPEKIITSIDVNLEKKPENVKLNKKFLLNTSPLVVNSVVTNFTEDDLGNEIKKNFKTNNIYLGNTVDIYPSLKDELVNPKYMLAAQIVSSNQVKGFYAYPYFNLAEINIQWTIINLETKEILFNKETEGNYLTRYKSTKGLIASDEMKKVVVECIEDAQIKLLNDTDFKKLFN